MIEFFGEYFDTIMVVGIASSFFLMAFAAIWIFKGGKKG
jgi:hypothetical protein